MAFPGYSHIKLMSESDKEIPGATLFVHVSINKQGPMTICYCPLNPQETQVVLCWEAPCDDQSSSASGVFVSVCLSVCLWSARDPVFLSSLYRFDKFRRDRAAALAGMTIRYWLVSLACMPLLPTVGEVGTSITTVGAVRLAWLLSS